VIVWVKSDDSMTIALRSSSSSEDPSVSEAGRNMFRAQTARMVGRRVSSTPPSWRTPSRVCHTSATFSSPKSRTTASTACAQPALASGLRNRRRGSSIAVWVGVGSAGPGPPRPARATALAVRLGVWEAQSSTPWSVNGRVP
jgi:hypothetical protein